VKRKQGKNPQTDENLRKKLLGGPPRPTSNRIRRNEQTGKKIHAGEGRKASKETF